MAKIAYIGIPAHGHTNPTLALVQELTARGHHILYYNAESFRAKVEPTGVDFRAYPAGLPTERDIAEAMSEFINASLIMSRMGEMLAPFVLEEMTREKPDLILYDSASMAGYIAARTLGIPHICLLTHFVLNGSRLGFGAMARFMWSAIPHLPRLIGWKRRMKQRYGDKIAGGITEYADLNIVFTSRDFHPANTFVDDRFRFVGASINVEARGDASPLGIDADYSGGSQTRPYEMRGQGGLIYISLGTINHLDRAFYRAAFEAFGDYRARFVLSAGNNTDIAALGEIPVNFTVRASVPQLEILQQADAFITHGGMNSVHEGLYFGVPLVVVPHQFEQLLNGRRVAETGAGVLLGDAYPYGRVTAAELRGGLDSVLGNPAYRQNAARIGESLKKAGGYSKAADEIEGYVGVGERAGLRL
jgi:MGT family glycosyltransferase